MGMKILNSKKAKLKIKILAINDKDREKGLMFADPLRNDECAFFIFDSPQSQKFWNKNVSFPIDVAFFNIDGKLSHIGQLNAHQEKPIDSIIKDVKYVIETTKNWFAANKIKVGARVWELIDIRDLRQ